MANRVSVSVPPQGLWRFRSGDAALGADEGGEKIFVNECVGWAVVVDIRRKRMVPWNVLCRNRLLG